ncbi:MAG TPA: tRNA (N6-isopentenyl adenosine(37)-C2)-methylthiotransferase MiaB [Firmicutes bacterium]|nr:tRNA (N6-isopentenyl adenosine(37)-C2)-methylthiotransferase MiaB [Candidatus Fermentithermobacillaceae bacterium]
MLSSKVDTGGTDVVSGEIRYYIETFGCQMNQRDSETIAGLLETRGMKPAENPREADVVVVNTCAVRQAAERKVWSRLGEIAAMKPKGREPVIVLAGCMAQLPETLERVKDKVPYVNVVTGPGQLDKIPRLVEEAMDAKTRGVAFQGPLVAVSPRRTEAERSESTQVLPENLPRVKVPGVSAYVTIMYGCDNFCTYCIVPFVRGPQVSRDPRSVIDEVERLAQEGYKEVTLLGQNVNAYGHDLGGNYDFGDLLADLDKVPGLLRIRYATSHPRDFTPKMVDIIRDSEKVCEHFHLPVQSGSNRILKAMHRGYTRERYLELVEYIKSQIPGASITTDIIVGFPGETEEDFHDTLDLVRQCRFDGAFTFIFSPRQGTAAAKMEGQIPHEEKSRRLERLVEVQNSITRENNRRLLGKTVEILVEGPDEREPEHFRGRTRTNRMVICTSGKAEPGQLVHVRIQEAGTWYLKGPMAQD